MQQGDAAEEMVSSCAFVTLLKAISVNYKFIAKKKKKKRRQMAEAKCSLS